MPLKANEVNKAGPGKHSAGSGLYLHVNGNGARRWICRVTHNGRRRELGIGPSHTYTLVEARQRCRIMKQAVIEGRDPVVAHRSRARTLTFSEAAQEVWRTRIVPTARNPKHRDQWINTLNTYAFPHIGQKPVGAVTQPDVLAILAPIWHAKKETAKRVRQRIRVVIDWAKTAGHFEGENPVEGIERGLGSNKSKVRHHAALSWEDLPEVYQRIEGMDGQGARALQFTVLCASRSGEVRGARWSEMNFSTCTWTIPGDRMKNEEDHRVPLSEPAMAILRAQEGLHPDLVFPSPRGKLLSDMTLAAVLKRLEIPVTVHGMRSTFRDWAAEATSFPREIAEHALSHKVGNKVERAYHRSDMFAKRADLMASWASFVTQEKKMVQLAVG